MSKGPGLFVIGHVPQPLRSPFYTFLNNFALTIIWIGSTYIVVTLNLYEEYKSKKGITPNTNRVEISLKLEAQKVTAFSGNFADWSRWKSRTQCAFDGSGNKKC